LKQYASMEIDIRINNKLNKTAPTAKTRGNAQSANGSNIKVQR
jgi:hypothetical protein